jgi:CBS domain-containing protein
MFRHNRDHGDSEHGGHVMTVRELVNGNVVWVAPDATLRQAALLMMSNEVGSVAIEVDGALEGILTERDILRAVADDADLDQDRVSTWMTEYPDSFTPDMNVEEAAEWMLATGFRHLPVVDGNEVMGVISIKDVLWAITDSKV